MTIRRITTAALVALLALTATGCSSYKKSLPKRQVLMEDAKATVARLRSVDPTIKRFFTSAAGYAVFPKVTKGAVGIGAAHGNGVVHERRRIIGFAELTQATIGAQLGGQTYSEIIFFQKKSDLAEFKGSRTQFAAQASAVAASNGAAANADYSNGVAVFTLGQRGLMFEASVGGQKFKYSPK